MNKYITITDEHGRPAIIFRRNIIAISQIKEFTKITCVDNIIFYTLEDFSLIVRKINDNVPRETFNPFSDT